MTHASSWLPLPVICVLSWSCAPNADGEPASVPAVKVTPGGASSAATLELSEQAVTRLGLRVEPVEELEVASHARISGEVVLPPEERLELRAPFAALVHIDPALPRPGGTVESGQILVRLEPRLAPEAGRALVFQDLQAEALARELVLLRTRSAGELELAEARLVATRQTYERARAMAEAQAGSARTRDEAEAGLHESEAALASARGVAAALEHARVDGVLPAPQALVLVAPRRARLAALEVVDGQLVVAGTACLRLDGIERLLLRVPVPSSRSATLATAATARLAAADGSTLATALALVAPPSADFARDTVDLWFEFAPPLPSLAPGQRVTVELETRQRALRRSVPFPALLFDVQERAWVYVSAGGTSYRRQPVEYERVEDGRAYFTRGPEVGANVVTVGAAELYGIEFGAGK